MLFLKLVYRHLLVILLAVALVVSLIWSNIKDHKNSKTILQLQNASALKDKTIEEQKGLYEKLAVQTGDVKTQLDSKDVQIVELENQLKKDGEQLSNATTINIQLKQALQAKADATQTKVSATGPTASDRLRVDFRHDFGWLAVSGYTLTNPADATVSLDRLGPLKFTVAMAQDKQKAWHAYVTSSVTDLNADIAVASVNPFMDDEKWYERLGATADVGLGTTPSGAAALAGVGVSLELNKFEFGPHVWVLTTDRFNTVYGATLTWHPWKR